MKVYGCLLFGMAVSHTIIVMLLQQSNNNIKLTFLEHSGFKYRTAYSAFTSVGD